MNCDCISDIEKRLAAHMKPQAGETARASCAGSALFIIGGEAVSGLSIPFRVTGDKKGFTAMKGKEMPVVASFCPFCGKGAKREVPTVIDPTPCDDMGTPMGLLA